MGWEDEVQLVHGESEGPIGHLEETSRRQQDAQVWAEVRDGQAQWVQLDLKVREKTNAWG